MEHVLNRVPEALNIILKPFNLIGGFMVQVRDKAGMVAHISQPFNEVSCILPLKHPPLVRQSPGSPQTLRERPSGDAHLFCRLVQRVPLR